MFEDTKQKYVRLKEYDEIVIFPQIIQHSEFKNWDLISAGFCYVNSNDVACFGESISLGIKSDPKDSFLATKQVFGYDEAMKLINED